MANNDWKRSPKKKKKQALLCRETRMKIKDDHAMGEDETAWSVVLW